MVLVVIATMIYKWSVDLLVLSLFYSAEQVNKNYWQYQYLMAKHLDKISTKYLYTHADTVTAYCF